MNIDASDFYNPKLPWTGRADLLREKRAGVALVTELGRNYDAYHEQLASDAAKIGRPQPENYKTLREYLEAWGTVQAIVLAENLLRIAVTVVSGGEIKPLDQRPLLVSSDDRLLSLEEAEKIAAQATPAP